MVFESMCKYLEIEIREPMYLTLSSEYEDIKRIHDMLVEQNELNGWHIALHVGAASGDFITPFINPELQWDFRLPNVKSINVSGHKFGLGGRCTNAVFLRQALVDTDFFNIVDKAHMPLVAFSLKDSAVTIMRVVAKQNSSCQTAKMLVQDILHAVAALEQHPRMQHVSPAKTSMITSSVAVPPMPAL
ncbi:Pyridoxal phosphate-dependent transferase [Phytophthora cactorum]|nr:Pyridoxal phosphate-dependent transferase [Phytophthora cactorum]